MTGPTVLNPTLSSPARVAGSSLRAERCSGASIAASAPGGTGAEATFKFGDEGANDDDTAVGNIITTNLANVVTVGDLNRATYTFVGSGDLTFAGENSLITAGTLGVSAANTATTLTAANGKTYSGSTLASTFTINCPIDGLVDVTGTLQGTGALTIA